MKLMNGLVLHNVLVVPKFNHNLLYIHKLVNDNGCPIKFAPKTCAIVGFKTLAVRTLDKVYNGLYYLFDNGEGSSNAV